MLQDITNVHIEYYRATKEQAFFSIDYLKLLRYMVESCNYGIILHFFHDLLPLQSYFQLSATCNM